ncbi:hypothetical protein HMF7854_14885 [Sphingomonas ginkgonis]|uniref:YdhG-like domain-containing protein n=1 Tax=Sphingomonas ginkgonis TaxID=2315330 RepID=A0A3R9WUB7_9SPHN|nr:YdeI/OmpD-associated family protein [Sphingomonas ginkgonis]RST31981.1 hypothetical protein HMF7854_14885 [Sphingomonas ginkgonis]
MSRSAAVDDYVAAAPPFARSILEHVRGRVHALVPDAEEAIKWAKPAYLVGGRILLVTAAFKAHAALSFWRAGTALPNAETSAMGQFGRLTALADLPDDTRLDALIVELAEAARTPATAARRSPATSRPALEPHPAFLAALDSEPAARAQFDRFSDSCRREYIEWISEAKRDDTRARRIAEATGWIAQGRKRNWRYER